MLVINWKKHYIVPGFFYNYKNYHSDRKAKFYFLADFVFKLIYKFSFRLVLYAYIRFLSRKRMIKGYSRLIMSTYHNQFVCQHLYSKFNSLYSRKKKLISTKLFNIQVNFLLNFYNFILLFEAFLNKLKTEKKKYLFFFSKVLTYTYSVTKKHYKYSINNFIHSKCCYEYLVTKQMLVLDILDYKINTFPNWKWKLLRSFLLKKYGPVCFVYESKRSFFSELYLKYFKSYSKINELPLKRKHLKILYLHIKKLKNKKFKYLCRKPFELNNIYYYENFFKRISKSRRYHDSLGISSFHFNSFLSSFHNILSYLFYNYKLIDLKSYDTINFLSMNHLRNKKKSLFLLKSHYKFLKIRFKYLRHRHIKSFTHFFNNALNKYQFLIGPKKKRKLYRYIMRFSRTLRKKFRSLNLTNFNRRKSFNKMSFFYNPIHIRKHLFIFLGKKRYSEEFLYLNNKKWYLKSYITQYYNITLKQFYFFIKCLKKKVNIHFIKDLFLFIEYNLSVFLKKYAYYSFIGNIKLNLNMVNLKNKTLFLNIGDVIHFDKGFFFYYDKFLLLFNFLLYINPVVLKTKLNLLNLTYQKLYYYLYSVIYSNQLKYNSFFSDQFNNIRFINFIKHIIFFDSSKSTIKSLFFFINKYNFRYYYKNSTSHLFNYSDDVNFSFFSKTFDLFSLIHLKKSRLARKKRFRRRKRFFSFKSHFSSNVYKAFLYNSLSKIKKNYSENKLSVNFNEKVYGIYFKKKMSFLRNINNWKSLNYLY